MVQSPSWEANWFAASQEFPAFHGTRRFIAALTSVRHLSLSWASPIQSIYPHPTSWRSIPILSTHLCHSYEYVFVYINMPHLGISDTYSIHEKRRKRKRKKKKDSQLYNVSFQKHSKHWTAVMPLHFNQTSCLLLPALIYGPTSLLRGFLRLYFHPPDRVVLWGQTNEHHYSSKHP